MMRWQRRGFTLVEMLVVLAIIAALGALLAFTLPGFRERSRAAKGGQALQGWLNYARQRAQYEHAPRGIRCLITTSTQTGGYVIRECQYVEKPDDWGGLIKMQTLGNSNNKLHFGFTAPEHFQDGSATVEAGDYIEVFGSGQPHRIVGFEQSDPKNKPGFYDVMVLDSNLPQTITEATTNYRVMRRPRVTGEDALKLPDDIVVDLAMFNKYQSPFGASLNVFLPQVVVDGSNNPVYFDLLFSPSGAVLDSGGGIIILWVRTEEGANEFAGNPTLVAISANSGAVAAYEPVVSNPYQKVK